MPSKQTFLMATRNKGKALELASLLEDLPVEILTLQDFPNLREVEESGQTFAENAALKAVYAARETGLITLSDDSGLEVDALGGKPGVYSARFAGEPPDDRRNNRKLLTLLQNVPAEQRTARFVCVVALAIPASVGEPEVHYASGACEGVILEEERGDGGFGYDPLFYVPSLQKTFAELSLEEKNRISHRGQALHKAVRILRPLLANKV